MTPDPSQSASTSESTEARLRDDIDRLFDGRRVTSITRGMFDHYMERAAALASPPPAPPSESTRVDESGSSGPSTGPFCPRCGHDAHDERSDPRCPEIVAANWSEDGPDPEYCGCADVDALYLRAIEAEARAASVPPAIPDVVEALAVALKKGDIGCEDHQHRDGGYHLASAHREDAQFIASELTARGYRLVPASSKGERASAQAASPAPEVVEALRKIAGLGTDAPAMGPEPEDFYRWQLAGAIGTATRALAALPAQGEPASAADAGRHTTPDLDVEALAKALQEANHSGPYYRDGRRHKFEDLTWEERGTKRQDASRVAAAYRDAAEAER